MYWHKTPRFVQWAYPTLVWHKSRNKKVIYITFDDGPVPEITSQVLSILDHFKAKATFFCVGDNVRKYPEIYHQILQANHKVGNHTYNHLNGWKISRKTYIENVHKCKEVMPEARFFRPAYGKMKRRTIKKIQEVYDIIMWDVLAGDFDQKLSKEQCLKNTIDATQKGSIIIFHDSLKAKNKLLYTLPLFLDFFSKQDYIFKAL